MKRLLHGLAAPLLLAVFLFVLPSTNVSAQGCMTVGSFDQSGGGTLSIDVLNTTPCTGHDQLQVTGAAILGGTLEILDLPGFVKPNTAAGNNYVVLTAGSLSGNFTSTSFPTIAGINPMVNLVWSYSLVGTTVVVNVKDPCNPDITPPSLTCPANTTIFTNPANQCTSPFNIQALASSSDNCSTATITSISVNALPGYSVGSPVVLPAGVNAVEYTVSDAAGNTATCTYNVTVIDNDPPILNCPPNITVQSSGGDDNIAGDCGATVQWSAFTVSDNCPGVNVVQIAGPAIGTFVNVGVSTVTYRATDLASNTSTCSFTVTVVDNEPPVMTPNMFPTAATVACPAAALVPPSQVPTVTDNCTSPLVPTIMISAAPACEGNVTHTYTWTDGYNPPIVWVYTYTVEYEDFTVPANSGTTVSCPAATNVAPMLPVVTDNCGNVLTPAPATVSAIPTCEGIRTYTYTYTDCEGNSHDWVYTYTVEYDDFTVPAAGSSTVACPNDTDVVPTPPTVMDNCGVTLTPTGPVVSPKPACEGTRTYAWTYTDCEGNTHDWVYTYTIEYLDFSVPVGGSSTVACPNDTDVVPTPPTVTDNCGVTLTPTGPVVSPKPTCEGTRTYTWTYTDCEGNTHPWVYTYTIEYLDFSVPAGGSSTVACPNDTDVVPTPPTVMDNCGVTLTPTGPVVSPKPTCEGTRTYTWTYTDCEGNTHPWVYTYTIEYLDFSVPANSGLTVDCPNDTDVVPTPPTVMDNCGVTLTPTGPVISAKPACEGTRTYTWTYTDCEGNTHPWVYTYTIEYEDFIMPANAGSTVACHDDSDVVPTPPTVMDNCGVTLVPTGPVDSGEPACEGTRTYTWTYTDCEGNTHPWVYTYTVDDNVPPTAVCPMGNVTITLNAMGQYTLSPAEVNALGAGSSDNCGVAVTFGLSDTFFDCDDSGNTDGVNNLSTRTLTVTDCASNTSTCSVTFRIMPLDPLADNVTETAVCSDVNFSFNLQSYIDNGVPSNFSYTANYGAATGGAYNPGPGTSATLSETLTNTTNAVVNVVYTISTWNAASSCQGSTFTLTVPINPEPVVGPQSTTVCSDVPNGLILADDVDGPSANTYNITNINSNGLIASAGAPITGTGFANNEIADDAWTNTTDAPVNVVYTVVPVSAAGCLGNPFTVTVTINPEPVVANQTVGPICSDVALGVNYNGDPGLGALTYNLISISNPGGLTPRLSVETAGTMGMTASALADDVWENKTNAIQTVTYTVEPVSSNGCVGSTFTVTITVRPEPVVNSFAAAAACSDVNVGASSTLPTTPVNTPVGVATYRWASLSVPGTISVNGAADPLALPFGTVNSSNAGNYPFNLANTGGLAGVHRAIINNDNFNNVTSLHDTVRYRIIPITSVATGSCAGDTFQVKVPVYPEPVGAGSTEMACSGVTFNYDLNENLTNLGVYPDPSDDDLEPITFNWQITSITPAPFAVGAAVGDTGSGATLTDNVTNIFTVPITVNYTVTPTSAFGCAGNTFVVSVVVNNKPLVTLNPNGDNTLCQGEIRNLLGSATNNPPSTFTYEWSFVGASGNASLANANTQNAILTAQTNNTNPLTVKLKVINAEGCSDSTTFTFTVNPVPTFAGTEPNDLSACATVANGQQGIFNLSNSVPTTTGSITYHVSASDANAGIGAIPNFGSYTGNNGQEIWVRLTGVNGCYAVQSIILTVNPLPVAAISGDLVLCAGETTTLTASGGGTYLWSTTATTNAITVSPMTTTSYSVVVTDGNGCTDSESVTVIVNPLPVAVITPSSATICNGASATLTATGGSSYAWSNGAVTPSITVSPSGTTTYTVTITDVNGCTDTESATITVNPNPTFAGAEPIALNVCESALGSNTGTFNLNAAVPTTSGTISFHGSQSDAVAGIGDIPNPGSYTGTDNEVVWVRVENGNGCYTVASFTLNTWTLPTASISGDLEICNGQSTTLTASGGGTYAWSNMAVTVAITVAPVATTPYTVVVTDGNGCTDSETVTVVVNPLPVAVITPSSATICNGASATLTATGGSAYAWSNGAVTPAITVSPSGTTTYTVTITDVNGCTDTEAATITVNPNPTFAGAEPIALNTCENVQGGGVGVFNLNNAVPTTSGTISFHVSQSDAVAGTGDIPNPATYTGVDNQVVWVRVENGNGCYSVASFTLNTWTLPTASITGDLEICNGQSTTLTASGGTGFVWSTTATTAAITVSPTADTNYSVVVTDGNGCTNSATVTVVVNPLPVVTIAASDELVCAGDAVTLIASGGGSYLWSNMATTAAITVNVNATTTYTVTVTDVEGCVNTGSKTITVSPAMSWASATATDVSCNGGADGAVSATVSGGTPMVTLAWEDGDGNPSSTSGLEAGTYHVTATDGAGCTIDTLLVVGEPSAIQVQGLIVTNVSCNGDSTGTAFAIVNGGTPAVGGYDIELNGSSITMNVTDFGFYFTGLPADTYEVVVTDDNGCTTAVQFTITEPTPLQVSATAVDAACNGGNGTITGFASGGTTGYTFFIDFPNGGQVSPVFSAPAGTYMFVVEDAQSCRDSVAVVVGQPALLTASTSTTNESCVTAEDGTATVTAAGGTPQYTYAWSNGQTTAIATGLAAGTYTVTVTDDNGCTATASATVGVTGPAAPQVVNCPADITLYVLECDISYAWVAPTITDNCNVIELDVDLDGAVNEGYAAGVQQANFAVGTYTVTYTNPGPDTVACTFNVTVIDTIPPVILCPPTERVACIEDISAPLVGFVAFINAGGVLNDNCTVDLSSVVHVSTLSTGTPECVNKDTLIRTYSVVDIYNNINTCGQLIIVKDSIAPTFVTYALDTLINCDADSTALALGAPTGDDNCAAPVTYSHSNSSTQGSNPANCNYYNYVVTRTWVVTDACGNTATDNQIITVQDTTAPTPVCVNINVNLLPSGTVSIVPADVNGASSDNCMPANLLNLSATPLSFTCGEVGPNNVVLTVTDACGNSATCVAVVTVVDTEPPVAICNSAIDVYLDAAGLATIDTTDINNGSWDNCAIDTMTLSVYNFDCTDVGTPVTVQMVVFDVYGNSDTCYTVVTVYDTIAPIAVCTTTNLYLNAMGVATVDAEDLDGGSSDACGGLTFAANPSNFDCTDVGANPTVLTVTDINGNSSTCVGTVMVFDTIDPIALCQNITIQLNASGNASITGVQLNNGSSDACGIASYSANPNTFNCSNVGPNTVVLTVTDVNGNTATCTSIVTVQDLVPPVALCQNITIQLNAGGTASITGAQLNNGSSDACGIASYSANPNTFNCSNVGPNTVVLTVTDVNGNTATCTSIVTVQDLVPPVALCQNITVQLNAGGTASITGAQLNNGSTDACGIASYSANPNTFNCSNVGPNTVVLTVTDVNGNTATCTSIVTVEDNVPPVANCQNVTVNLDVNGNGSTTASAVNNNSTDACGIDTMYLNIYNFDCSDVGPNTVVLTVVDVNGNSATCSAIVTVIDAIAPNVVCSDTTIYLNANGQASVTAAQLDGGSTDACGGLTFGASQTNFDCSDIGANNVVLTVTDVNGNSATCIAIVTVEDTLAPVFSQCPGNSTLNSDPNGCYQNYQILLDTIFDNCTAPGAIAVQVKGRVVANNGVIPMTISPLGTGGYTVTATFGLPVGNNKITVIATDAEGNVDSCQWFVQVNDIWAPIISNCPADVTVNVNPTLCTAQAFWPVPIPSDNCSGVMMTTQNNNQYFPGYAFPLGTTNVVYTATDASGNTTTCSFNVNVVGTCTPPAPDLSPEHTTGSTSYAAGQTKNVVVRIRNLSANPTTAPVTFFVQKMDPNFSVFVDPNATTATVGINNFSVMNSDWVITEQATRWRFVSKPGVVINGNTTNFVAIQLTATGNQGATANLTTTVVSGTGGGETPTNNNMKVSSLSIN